MGSFLRGALIEYDKDLLGMIPNIVLFQFNPESLRRSLQIPERPTRSSSQGESSQAGEKPTEQISFTAHFSAANQLNDGYPLAQEFGIGLQLAALEKMTYPIDDSGGLIGQALDVVGKSLGHDKSPSEQPIPREQYPRVLFFWGPLRILPVVIQSMSITEQQYDHYLNPIQAEVGLTLEVLSLDLFKQAKDAMAEGALKFSTTVKKTQAELALATSAEVSIDVIPF